MTPTPVEEAASKLASAHEGVRMGQRRVNLIWERTQSAVAVVVVMVTMLMAAFQTVYHPGMEVPTIMSVAFGTVVGFYFGRTNHARPSGDLERPL